MSTPLVAMAFTTGLLGTGHCIGMCGGLVTALSLSPQGRSGGWRFQLLYHLGRITTYTLIGAGVGWLGSAFAYSDTFGGISRTVLLASDIFIILVGLGTAGAFRSLNLMRLEFPAPARALSGAVRALRRLPPGWSALPLGLALGLLPCGLLYAIAITAAQTASPLAGSLMLLAFGLGTLPALLLFGGTAAWMGERARRWMLRLAGVLVAAMGLVNLLSHLDHLA